ncbi:unnamed protein product, partial [Rotaria sp. Silwood2]
EYQRSTGQRRAHRIGDKQEERSKVDDTQGSPMVVDALKEIIDD